MSDLIARLRALKMLADDDDHEAGEKAGRAWAELTASYRELESLAKIGDDYLDPDIDPERLLRLVSEEDVDGWPDQQFAEKLTGNPIPRSWTYWWAFLAGAMGAYHEVRDKL